MTAFLIKSVLVVELIDHWRTLAWTVQLLLSGRDVNEEVHGGFEGRRSAIHISAGGTPGNAKDARLSQSGNYVQLALSRGVR